jgi:NitT/TauT family transport system permease protein
MAERSLSLLALLTLWWGAAAIAHAPQLLPSPPIVLAVAWHATLTGALPLNLGITLLRVTAAFLLSFLIALPAGYLAGRSARIDAWLDPWLVVALNLPVLVVVVLIYIWVGLNNTAAVLAVAIAKFPTVMVTLREGARALDPTLDELAAAYRIPRWRRLRRIVLPQLAPYLAAAGRGGLSITWKIVLVVELIGQPNGVGFMLNQYFQDFDVAGIMAYGLIFAALMLLIETILLQPIERRARARTAA